MYFIRTGGGPQNGVWLYWLSPSETNKSPLFFLTMDTYHTFLCTMYYSLITLKPSCQALQGCNHLKICWLLCPPFIHALALRKMSTFAVPYSPTVVHPPMQSWYCRNCVFRAILMANVKDAKTLIWKSLKYTRNRSPEWHREAPSDSELSPDSLLHGCIVHILGYQVAKFDGSMINSWRDMTL